MAGLVPGATAPSRIDEFFTQVGEGMVAAQAELDRQSFDYNANRPGAALPSAYRIPKVHAEIGFTMSRNQSKRFGVFALGRASSGEKRHTNTVSFDILSVPPPAESLEEVPSGARWVNRLSEREDIRATLAGIRHDSAVSRSVANSLLAEFDRVLIFGHGRRYLLAHVVRVDDGIPATVQFGVLKTAPVGFLTHGAVPSSQSEQARWVQLRDFLNMIADSQENALAVHA